MTDEERQFLEQFEDSLPAEDSTRGPYAPPMPFQEGGGFLNNLGRGVANAPGSLSNLAQGVAGAAAHPYDNVLKPIGMIGKGAYDKAMGNETAEAQVASDAAESYWNYLNQPAEQALVNDPFGAALDLMPAPGSMGFRGAGAVRAAARFSAGVVDETAGVSRKVAQLVQKGLMSQETGAFEDVFQASRRGGKEAAAMRSHLYHGTPGFRGGKTALDFYDDFTGVVEGIADKQGRLYQSRLPQLTLKKGSPGLDLGALKREMREFLQSEDIEVIFDEKGSFTGLDFKTRSSQLMNPGRQQRLEKSIRLFYEWEDPTILGMDKLKKGMWQERVRNPGEAADFKEINNVIGGVYERIKKTLDNNVEGYETMTRDFHETKDFLRQIQEGFAVGGKHETVFNKIMPILRDPANFDFRKDLLEALEAMSDTP